MKRFDNEENTNRNPLQEQKTITPAEAAVPLAEEELDQVSGGVSGLTNRKNETEKSFF